MDEAKVREIIRQELAHFMKQSKFVFGKPIQIEDGNDITIGNTNGTRIGGTASLLSFFGKTPRIQYPHGYLIQPTGGTTVDNEARARIQDINALLVAFGFAYDVT